MSEVENASASQDSREADSGHAAISEHGLEGNAISLFENVVIGVASSAPGQSMAVTLAAIVVAANYGGGMVVLITALPMLAIAWAYSRLNMWEQNCGASYVWVGRAISPYVGFLVGWCMLSGWVLVTVSDILPLGPSLLGLVGLDPSSQAGTAISATVLGVVLTGLAVIGISPTAKFQVVIAGIEYVILFTFCAISLYFVFISPRVGMVHPTWGWLRPTGVGGKGSLVGGMLIAVYLFTGWDTSVYVNEETTRPEKNPGRAVVIGVAALALIYALLIVSLQGVASQQAIGDHSVSALVFIADQLVGNTWGKFMALAVVLSVMGTVQAGILSSARIGFSMGRDRVIPHIFGRLNKRYRTPAFATILFGALAIAMTWFYVFSSSVSASFDTAVSLTGILFAIFYAFTGFATTWYYRSLLGRSLKDALSLGLLPVASAAILIWIAVKSIALVGSQSKWTLLALVVLGVAAMLVSAFAYRAPFFSLPTQSFQRTDR